MPNGNIHPMTVYPQIPVPAPTLPPGYEKVWWEKRTPSSGVPAKGDKGRIMSAEQAARLNPPALPHENLAHYYARVYGATDAQIADWLEHGLPIGTKPLVSHVLPTVTLPYGIIHQGGTVIVLGPTPLAPEDRPMRAEDAEMLTPPGIEGETYNEYLARIKAEKAAAAAGKPKTEAQQAQDIINDIGRQIKEAGWPYDVSTPAGAAAALADARAKLKAANDAWVKALKSGKNSKAEIDARDAKNALQEMVKILEGISEIYGAIESAKPVPWEQGPPEFWA